MNSLLDYDFLLDSAQFKVGLNIGVLHLKMALVQNLSVTSILELTYKLIFG